MLCALWPDPVSAQASYKAHEAQAGHTALLLAGAAASVFAMLPWSEQATSLLMHFILAADTTLAQRCWP